MYKSHKKQCEEAGGMQIWTNEYYEASTLPTMLLRI